MDMQREYCRLCAQPTFWQKAVNFEENIFLKEKLLWFQDTLILINEDLPKTVCLACVASLESALLFINGVQAAQITLRNIFSKGNIQLKVEEDIPEDTNYDVVLPEEKVKCEIDTDTEQSENSIGEHTEEVECEISGLNTGEVVVKPAIHEPIKQAIQAAGRPATRKQAIQAAGRPATRKQANQAAGQQATTDKEIMLVPALGNSAPLPSVSNLKSTSNVQDEKFNDYMALDKCELLDSDDNESVEDTSDMKQSEPQSPDNNKGNKTWEHYSWQCRNCVMSFPTCGQLTSHSMEAHANCSTFKCTDCKRGSAKLHVIVKHIKEHRKHLQRSCHFCFKYMTNKKKLKQHIAAHTTSDHHCIGCHMPFTSKDDLSVHYNQYYLINGHGMRKKRTDGEVNMCHLCNNKVFKDRHNLLIHNQMFHKKHRYTCDQCGQSFGFNHHLRRHYRTKHMEKDKHQCKICNSVLKDFAQLRRHLTIHNTTEKYPCQDCGKVFRLKSLLAGHIKRLHTPIELHPCSICNKGFKTAPGLRDHQRTHTGEKPFQCSMCPAKFSGYSAYGRHMLKQHDVKITKRRVTKEGTIFVDPKTGEFGPLKKSSETEQWMKAVLEANPYPNVPEQGTSSTAPAVTDK